MDLWSDNCSRWWNDCGSWIEPIIQSMRYLEVTAKILKKYNGLWFNDESFVVSKKGS